METLICIDFGSSYTKVAVRNEWNEPTTPLHDLGADSAFSFCIPSTVACIDTSNRSKWLIGEDALSQAPGPNVRLYQNWKGHLLSEVDSDYDSVAIHFFKGLKRILEHKVPKLAKCPVRLCIPRLKNESHVEDQMLDILEIAGVAVANQRPCIFEPEANIYGVTTRGRNVAWRPKGSLDLEPHYGQMFERERGGLFDELRKATLKNEYFCYSILLIDIGSFTVDFGCVTFSVLGGHIDDFKTPDVVQESEPIGIAQLDESVLKSLRPTVRQAIEERPYRDWEDIKKRIYNEEEAAVRHKRHGMLVVGEGAEAAAIAGQIDDYADMVVKACSSFCTRYGVSPKKTVLTGGGVFIRGLRDRVASKLKRQLTTSLYDLLDENEYKGPILEKAIPGGGWRYDQNEVDARLRRNRELVRGGSAIGGCSVFIDLPLSDSIARPKKQVTS